jgi:hypothetical protein
MLKAWHHLRALSERVHVLELEAVHIKGMVIHFIAVILHSRITPSSLPERLVDLSLNLHVAFLGTPQSGNCGAYWTSQFESPLEPSTLPTMW